jgi:T5SS/PEP-CTERM-associated repeat protein
MIRALHIASFVLFALASAATAQTWDGGAAHGNATANNLWSTAFNWVGGTAPTSGVNTDLAFGLSGKWTTADQNIANPFILHSITFNSNNTNFTGISDASLDFHNNSSSSAPLINQNCNVAITINDAINFTDSISIQGSGTGGLTLSGPLSGSGNLTKSGTFALTLGADNSGYGGGVTISAGSIVLGNANGLAGSTVTVNVNNGLNLNAQASPTLGALGGSGNIAVGATATVFTVGGNNATTTYSGALTGSATDFVKAGTGNMTLSGTGSSVHGLDVTNGTVIIDSGGTFAATSTAGINGPRRAFEVGNSSTAASLIVQGGATLDTSTAQEAIVGLSSQTQTMTVQGTNTLWKLPNQADIGGGGPGTLIVQNGGKATGGSFLVAGNSGSGTIQILSGGQVTTGAVYLGFTNGGAGSGLLTVSGANSSLNAGVIVLANYGGVNIGTVNVTAGGSVTTGGLQISSLSSSVTVDGGTLSTNTVSILSGYSTPILVSDPAGGTALNIGASNGTSTIASPINDAISGPGTVVKNGTGALTLTGHLTNTGGYISNRGTIDFSGAVVQPQFGTLNAAGLSSTLKYDNNARVFGGFMTGPGLQLITGASFTGTSSSNSAVINVAGAATLTNFSNSGSLSVNAGISPVPVFSTFINQGAGSLTVGANSKVSLLDFQTYGTMTVSPATITENFSQTTLLTNNGSSQLNFNGGSRTFVGTSDTALFPSNWPDVALRGTPTFVAGFDLNGKNAVVAGGLFVNNGFVEDTTNGGSGTAHVVADFGALVKGAGFFQNSVQTVNGGVFQAGNSPGKASFGSFVFGPGGVNKYVLAINDATGTAGPTPDAAGHVSGWGFVKAVAGGPGGASSGDFAWTATPTNKLTVSVQTLINPTTVGTDVPGLMDHFDPNAPYTWLAVQWAGNYAGPTDAAALDASTVFDATGFLNPMAGRFGWSLDAADHMLSLVYTPSAVPEPGTLALAGLAAAGLAWRRRRLADSFGVSALPHAKRIELF